MSYCTHLGQTFLGFIRQVIVLDIIIGGQVEHIKNKTNSKNYLAIMIFVKFTCLALIMFLSALNCR